MLIGSGEKIKNIRNIPHIFMYDDPIKRVKCTKSLGVRIDEELTWTVHIDYISKKISRAIGGLRQARPYVPKNTLITIYKVLIEPLFDYCDILWNNLSAEAANRLRRLQYRAARVITKQWYDVRSMVPEKN